MMPPSRYTGLLVLLGLLGAALPAAAGPPKQLWIDHKRKPGKARALTERSFATLAETTSPSVVNIIVTFREGDGLAALRGSDMPDPRAGKTAVGSGFIIHPDGHVLTNNHVIEGASEIKVRLNDNREFRAHIVGRDPKTDVALVRIEGKNVSFKAVPLGDSDALKVGEQVLAIGNPLGLNHTVTSGIISALGRKDLAPGGKQLESDFIQTDASINPGNSGGPLISLQGDVIGINTAINRQGQGIGFAIPINMVKQLLPQLQARGFVERTWLGIRVQPITPLLAKSFGLKRARGALVSEVVENSPAARGGLQAGDVILKFGVAGIKSRDQLSRLISMGGPKSVIPVSILRERKPLAVSVTLEAIPNQERPTLTARKKAAPAARPDLEHLGLSVKDLTTSLARQLGAQGKKGVVVTDVAQASPARVSGLRQRDVILELGTTGVSSAAQFYTLIDAARTGQIIRLRVMRGGRAVYLAFER